MHTPGWMFANLIMFKQRKTNLETSKLVQPKLYPFRKTDWKIIVISCVRRTHSLVRRCSGKQSPRLCQTNSRKTPTAEFFCSKVPSKSFWSDLGIIQKPVLSSQEFSATRMDTEIECIANISLSIMLLKNQMQNKFIILCIFLSG